MAILTGSIRRLLLAAILLFKRLPLNQRISLWFRGGAITTCLVMMFMFRGQPPMHAQRQAPVFATERVITNEDHDQDIAIVKFQEFEDQQKAWNKQTGTDVAEALLLSRSVHDNIVGVLKFIAALVAVGTLTSMYQARKKA